MYTVPVDSEIDESSHVVSPSIVCRSRGAHSFKVEHVRDGLTLDFPRPVLTRYSSSGKGTLEDTNYPCLHLLRKLRSFASSVLSFSKSRLSSSKAGMALKSEFVFPVKEPF